MGMVESLQGNGENPIEVARRPASFEWEVNVPAKFRRADKPDTKTTKNLNAIIDQDVRFPVFSNAVAPELLRPLDTIQLRHAHRT